jgi:hypothetical protein
MVCKRLDLRRTADANLELLANGVERAMTTRMAEVDSCTIDIDYREILADPVAVVARILEFHGLPFRDGHERRIAEYVAANPQHKHGVHRYRAEDFGQHPDQIRERFAGYIRRFESVLGAS